MSVYEKNLIANSQSLPTFSFHEPGLWKASCILLMGEEGDLCLHGLRAHLGDLEVLRNEGVRPSFSSRHLPETTLVM